MSVLVKELRDRGACAGSMEHIEGGGWWSTIECMERRSVDDRLVGCIVPQFGQMKILVPCVWIVAYKASHVSF